mmetsp:Transcript_8798/g.27574  ORF Transcript_8798/g.27574 Transcript_8798/m.27574 type:complete len:476 (+) Transcript_8798:56-1483(+)
MASPSSEAGPGPLLVCISDDESEAEASTAASSPGHTGADGDESPASSLEFEGPQAWTSAGSPSHAAEDADAPPAVGSPELGRSEAWTSAGSPRHAAEDADALPAIGSLEFDCSQAWTLAGSPRQAEVDVHALPAAGPPELGRPQASTSPSSPRRAAADVRAPPASVLELGHPQVSKPAIPSVPSVPATWTALAPTPPRSGGSQPDPEGQPEAGPKRPPQWVYSDGGRAEAGFRGTTGDCFTRAVAIACERPYREIYDFVNKVAKEMEMAMDDRVRGSLGRARTGVRNPLFHEVMRRLGWSWQPTMRYGQGCQVHLCAEELPPGRLVVRVTKHLVAVIDGVVHDTHDPSRSGSRCVYGYFAKGPGDGCPLGSLTSADQAPPAAALAALPAVASAAPRLRAPWPLVRAAQAPAMEAPLAHGGGRRRPQARRAVAPIRSLTEPALAALMEAQKGFSDDDSDAEVRRRCHWRRVVARRG